MKISQNFEKFRNRIKTFLTKFREITKNKKIQSKHGNV